PRPEGREGEASAHHSARPVGYVRVRARSRSGRMGGVRRLHVRARGSGCARGQITRGLPRGISRRHLARLVDAGADRGSKRGGSRRAGRAAGTATLRAPRRARPRRRPRGGARGGRLRRLALRSSPRYADRRTPHLRGRGAPRGISQLASSRHAKADARLLVPRSRERRGAARGGRSARAGAAQTERVSRKQTTRRDRMADFWLSCGHHLLDRGEGGGLLVTDEFLKAYLARPELAPPPNA